MVHPDGQGPALARPGRASSAEDSDRSDQSRGRHAPLDRARRDRATRWVPEKGRNRIQRDGRGAARLGDQPPARLGRADRAVRRPQDRRVSASTRRSTRASSTPSSEGGADAWFGADHQALARRWLRPRRLRAGHRHPRRLVRQRLDPRLRRSRRATARACAPTSMSRARTSIAAGSSRRCSKAAARAGARRTTRC